MFTYTAPGIKIDTMDNYPFILLRIHVAVAKIRDPPHLVILYLVVKKMDAESIG